VCTASSQPGQNRDSSLRAPGGALSVGYEGRQLVGERGKRRPSRRSRPPRLPIRASPRRQPRPGPRYCWRLSRGEAVLRRARGIRQQRPSDGVAQRSTAKSARVRSGAAKETGRSYEVGRDSIRPGGRADAESGRRRLVLVPEDWLIDRAAPFAASLTAGARLKAGFFGRRYGRFQVGRVYTINFGGRGVAGKVEQHVGPTGAPPGDVMYERGLPQHPNAGAAAKRPSGQRPAHRPPCAGAELSRRPQAGRAKNSDHAKTKFCLPGGGLAHYFAPGLPSPDPPRAGLVNPRVTYRFRSMVSSRRKEGRSCGVLGTPPAPCGSTPLAIPSPFGGRRGGTTVVDDQVLSGRLRADVDAVRQGAGEAGHGPGQDLGGRVAGPGCLLIEGLPASPGMWDHVGPLASGTVPRFPG